MTPQEINETIAVKMFGANLYTDPHYGVMCKYPGHTIGKHIYDYHYYIDHAMKIIDKLRESGKYCCINIQSDYDYIWEVWMVRGRDESHTKVLMGQSEKLSEAICDAAINNLNHNGEKYKK